MRDIRGDLQDRASILEAKIITAEAQFEKHAGQLRRDHEIRVEDLKDELEAVTTLMEVEVQRLASAAPAQDEPRRPAPYQRRPAPEAEPYRRPVASEGEYQRRPAPQSDRHYQRPVVAEAEHQRRPAVEVEPRRRPAPMAASEVEQDRRLAAPQVYHRPAPTASAPETGQRRPVATASQPPQPPLADFLIRKLSEIGAMAFDDLCHHAVQEGYFADGEIADRAIHVTLMNVVKAGFIRQLPNGTFAPATVMDTIRLRRAI